MGAARFQAGSFRDPHGRVFLHEGQVYRALSANALSAFEALVQTRFYERERTSERLVQTEQLQADAKIPRPPGDWPGLLRHETVPFISYPFEWCFGMLQDAALEQLRLLRLALAEGMTLKDASPYNSQWRGALPIFIDISSFEKRKPGQPWAGYRQFCQLFLFPLLLQAYKDLDFQPFLRGRLEGVSPVDFIKMMSWRDRFRPGVFGHGYLHAKLQTRFDDSGSEVRGDLKKSGFNEELIKHNVSRLEKLISNLKWSRAASEWSEYTEQNTYDKNARDVKTGFVNEAVRESRPELVWDLGANTGEYSRVAAVHADYVVAMDADHLAVERLYQSLKAESKTNILPLVVDLADPPPALGWGGIERQTLSERGKPDLILALALIHHLVIGRNVPLPELISWLANQTRYLVIEFVGKTDPMVKRLLQNREDVFKDYDQAHFESYLSEPFDINRRLALQSGERTLYYCALKNAI